jgi:hypothetical protein
MSTIEVKPTTAPDGLKFTPSPQAALVPVITVDPTANTFTPPVTPPTGTVPAGSQIRLQSAVSNLTPQVYTFNTNKQLIQAFVGSQPPYAAPPGGTTYTLAATGTIILSLSSTLSVPGDNPKTDPKNGTINVGGKVSIGTL